MVSDEPDEPWSRRPAESARAYEAFRRFRDLGPLRKPNDVASMVGVDPRSCRRWAYKNDWDERANAWDDEVHAVADRTRIEAIRTMHEQHARTARAAIGKALSVINAVPEGRMPPGAAVRLLELGLRVERETLTISVEELQGVSSAVAPAEDPWDQIARELQGAERVD